jgi:hypothetical protein
MHNIAKLVIAGGLLAATSAQGAVVSLNFEGIAPYPNLNNVFIQNYYNGGTASNGNSGPNVGASFGSNALLICLNSTTTFCSNTSRGGLAPTSSQGGLFFLSGSETFLNYAAGFTSGFSFNYVSLSFAGSVGVYDGLNGTGNLLATLGLAPNAGSCPAYGAQFCPFSPTGVNFSGTAKSISFGGVANQIVFDDITFGSSTPGPDVVPEPASWAMLIAGFGLVGAAMRRRKAVATA